MRGIAQLLRSFTAPDGVDRKRNTVYSDVVKEKVLDNIKAGVGSGFLVNDATQAEATALVARMNQVVIAGKAWEVAETKTGSLFVRCRNDFSGLMLPGEEA